MDPLALEGVEPNSEGVFIASGGASAVVVIAVTGEPGQVVAEEMAAQAEHVPLRAGRWQLPVAGVRLP
jgi:hypothetical protein